jgi:hypothetical protein
MFSRNIPTSTSAFRLFVILTKPCVYIRRSLRAGLYHIDFTYSKAWRRCFQFLILYTVGRTPWTGDQPVARPLPARRTTQKQNKRTQTSMPNAVTGWSSGNAPEFYSEGARFESRERHRIPWLEENAVTVPRRGSDRFLPSPFHFSAYQSYSVETDRVVKKRHTKSIIPTEQCENIWGGSDTSNRYRNIPKSYKAIIDYTH